MIGCLLKARMLPHHICQLEAVDLGHADVHQHDRDVTLQQVVQRLASGVRFHQTLSEIVKNHLVAQQL